MTDKSSATLNDHDAGVYYRLRQKMNNKNYKQWEDHRTGFVPVDSYFGNYKHQDSLMKDRQEYGMYAEYALERYLIEKEGYNEYDAKVKVMQDYDEVKKWFEETEKVSLPARSY